VKDSAPDTLHAVIELQQLVINYWHEVDFNDARNLTDLYTEDCTYFSGKDINYKGHEGIERFYANSRAIRGDGARSVRHSASNIKVTVHDRDRGSVWYLLTTYAAYGVAPIETAIAPSQITDINVDCVRGADGVWRIAKFTGDIIMMGPNSLTKKLEGWKAAT
jgi:hypothetical protein